MRVCINESGQEAIPFQIDARWVAANRSFRLQARTDKLNRSIANNHSFRVRRAPVDRNDGSVMKNRFLHLSPASNSVWTTSPAGAITVKITAREDLVALSVRRVSAPASISGDSHHALRTNSNLNSPEATRIWRGELPGAPTALLKTFSASLELVEKLRITVIFQLGEHCVHPLICACPE